MLKCGNHTCEKPCHGVTQRRKFVDNKEVVKYGTSPDGDGKDTCRQCWRTCDKPLKVCAENHKCAMPCHPSWVECKPCAVEKEYKCHCGIDTLTIPCHLTIDAKVLEAEKSCGNTCNRDLPGCSHFCTDICHPGACGACNETVTLTCKCGNRKEEMPCLEHQKECNSSSARLDSKNRLICDESCEVKKQERIKKQKEIQLKRSQEKERTQMLQMKAKERKATKRRAKGGKIMSAQREKDRKEALKLLKKKTKTQITSTCVIGVVVALIFSVIIAIVIFKPTVV